MGSIYKRGQVYWIQYYHKGRPYRESTGSKLKAFAKQLLKYREGDIAKGRLPGIIFDRVTFDDLAETLIRDYELNQRRSIDRVRLSIRHLKEFFGHSKAPTITTPRIQEYIDNRLSEGAAPATINRELSALRRMFSIAFNEEPPRVQRVPKINKLKENNIRKGFFEHGNFLEVRRHLPNYLKPVMTFGYKTGWRVSEITGLRWHQADIKNGLVRIEGDQTKNGQARTIYLDDELKSVLINQRKRQKATGKLAPYIFPNTEGIGHIRNFRKAWATACKNAGCPGLLFHDLRRTAVRNLVRSGVPEAVAMQITGHKTRSVFDRYNIVSESDLRNAAKTQELYLDGQNRHNLSTIANLEGVRQSVKEA